MFSWLDELPVEPAGAAGCGDRSGDFCEAIGGDSGGAAGLTLGGGPSSDAAPVGPRSSAFSSRCAAAIPSFGEGRGSSTFA